MEQGVSFGGYIGAFSKRDIGADRGGTSGIRHSPSDPALHNQIADRDLYHFAVLVHRRRPELD